MELTINGQVYKFNFGMGFLREIDSKLKRDMGNGVKVDAGFTFTFANFVDGSVVALVDILHAANVGQNPRITKEALDNYVENTDVDELYENVMGFLKTANVLKQQTTKLLKAVEESKNVQE